jgi:Domain of unknown function (DUF4345)
VSQAGIAVGQHGTTLSHIIFGSLMTSPSAHYRNARVGFAAPTTGRQRVGTSFIILSGSVLVASAITKFLGVDAVVGQLEAFGFAGEIVPLGILEVATASLFLLPRTRFAGLLMFSAFLGGAVATHIQHHVLPVPPAIVLILGWVGVWMRYAAGWGDPAAAMYEFSDYDSPEGTAPQRGVGQLAVRANQVVLALAALLFFAIGAKYVFDPAGSAAASGIALVSPLGFTNMRAGLGGFSLGLGVVAAMFVPFAKRTSLGLRFLVAVIGTVLIVRVVGASSDGTLRQSRPVLIAEAVLLALAVGAMVIRAKSHRGPRGA